MDWRGHIARYGQGWFPGERWVRWTLGLLFLLAAILRFWDLPHIPLTHDELSALVRIYPTLWETIQRGVIELDTHPPGVQVFEWFWTKAFGMNEHIVKLPFLVAALLALFLLYRFALAWTSAPTALVVTTLLATLQYTVMYAQIARPYAIGFFTTALLADQLTRYLAFGSRRALTLTGVAAVMSAYTHHFSLFLAGLMVATGLLLVRADQRKAYLIMCGASLISFLPNVPIFLKQLSLGGLAGWLQPPDRFWLGDYLRWLTHFSVPFAAMIGVALLTSLVLRVRKGGSDGRIVCVLLTWGLTPLIIGLAYSIWRAPVIQYSMLLFSFPYVLMALFGGLRWLDRTTTMIVCAALAIISIHTLIFQRHHYTVFYASKYEAMMQAGLQAAKIHGTDHTLVLLGAPDPQVVFYKRQWHLADTDLAYTSLHKEINSCDLDSVLRKAAGKTVVVGITNGTPPEQIALVQERFPFIQEREDLVEGQVFVFADSPGAITVEDRALVADATPNGRAGGRWDIHQDLPTKLDSANGRTYWDFNGREFGAMIDLDMTAAMTLPDDLFEVIVDVDNPAPKTDMAVILEIKVGDSLALYKGGDLDRYNATGPVSLVVATARTHALRRGGRVRLNAYIYNRGLAPVKVYRIRVYRRDANPLQNALFNPVPRLGRTR